MPILRRIFEFIAIYVATTLLVFFFIKLAPGNPYAGWTEALKESFGVDDPLLIQYLDWLAKTVILDFGYSVRELGQPVLSLVLERLSPTLLITCGALAFNLFFIVPFAYVSVFSPYSRWVKLTQRIIELFSSIPIFIIGFGAFYLCLAYAGLNFSLRDDFSTTRVIVFYGIVFVILGMGNGTAMELLKHSQAEFISVKEKLYMRAVEARSVNYVRHLLRGAAIPLLTVLSSRIVFLLSGAVIIEYLFTIPGIGLLSINAARARDYPLILGITAVTILIVMIVKTATTLMIRYINPRTSSVL